MWKKFLAALGIDRSDMQAELDRTLAKLVDAEQSLLSLACYIDQKVASMEGKLAELSEMAETVRRSVNTKRIDLANCKLEYGRTRYSFGGSANGEAKA